MRAAFRSRSSTRDLWQRAAARRSVVCTAIILTVWGTSLTARAQLEDAAEPGASPTAEDGAASQAADRGNVSPTAEDASASRPRENASPSAAQPVDPYRSVVAPDLAVGAAVPSHQAVPQTREREVEVSETETRWYGSHNLIVDGGMATLLIVGGAAESPAAMSAGAIGYLIGSPIVHWAHGNVGEGFGSLGLRVAAAGVLLVGTALCVSNALGGDSDGGCAVAVAGAISVPAVVAIDAAVLAYEEVPAAEVSSTTVAPWMNERRRAAGVSWIGRF